MITRVVAKFADGNTLNIVADSIVRDNGVVEVWKRVPTDEIMARGAVYETVGVFAENAIDYIYMSESKGETK